MNAQPPTRFYTTFGGDGEDIAYGVKQTRDRQYIVVGSTSSFKQTNSDVYLIKVDSMGFSLWQKSYGGNGNDIGKSIVELPDSGFVMTGFSDSNVNNGFDCYTIRTDKNGNVLWERYFGGDDWDFGNDICVAPDGNIVVVGSTTSFGNGKKDGFVIK
jgi:hypothetical protein